MPSLFDSLEGSSSYLRAKEYDEWRSWYETLWENFQLYAAPDFKRNFQKSEPKFNSLTWEMILANKLIESGFELVPVTSSDAPDICVLHQGIRTWFECTMPTRGDRQQNEDAVEDVIFSEIDDDIPAREIDINANILRCTSVINYKKDQHLRWLREGVCQPNEPFIIALHGKNLDLRLTGNMIPCVAGALYCMGAPTMSFSRNDQDNVECGYLHQPSISRNNGTEIETNFFLNRDNAHVSGLLFSVDWAFHYSTVRKYYSYIPNLYTQIPNELDMSNFAQICEATINDRGFQLRAPNNSLMESM